MRERLKRDLTGFLIAGVGFLIVGACGSVVWGISEVTERAALHSAVYRRDVAYVLQHTPRRLLEEEIERRDYEAEMAAEARPF